ncbi:hypothetical protein DIPPA_27366 [Diplonema papillatum]|nr:hypothetical protein DIPPA_06648 [Diplonema papillatum]KAJ9436912.1 hypothetical protein DIPPA_06643 [Diplonema papillatum]KAJ9440457.1 hypothetical protein DIPPA_05011 [Diplonema papillatum]KAJ9458414.1 hypothetical protein DIPPA_27366 [Diplonema papillatum]
MLQLADELTVSPTCDQRLQGRTLWALVNPESREAAARQLGGTVMASIRVQKVKAALTKLARTDGEDASTEQGKTSNSVRSCAHCASFPSTVSACGGGVAGAGGGGGASTCSGGSGVAGAGGGSARRTLLRASPPASPGFRLEQAGGGEGGAGAGGGGVSGADRGDQYNHF